MVSGDGDPAGQPAAEAAGDGAGDAGEASTEEGGEDAAASGAAASGEGAEQYRGVTQLTNGKWRAQAHARTHNKTCGAAERLSALAFPPRHAPASRVSLNSLTENCLFGCCCSKKTKNLGLYDTAEEAARAWCALVLARPAQRHQRLPTASRRGGINAPPLEPQGRLGPG